MENHFQSNNAETMNVDHLSNECKRIEEDALYTAETHYITASFQKRIAFWTKLFPAIVTAVSGGISSLHLADWIGWLTTLSAIATALGVVHEPDRTFNEHTSAAKDFTVLRQKARYLYKTYRFEVTRDDFFRSVNELRERYNELVYSTPQTARKHFLKARKRIQTGIHKPDFESE